MYSIFITTSHGTLRTYYSALKNFTVVETAIFELMQIRGPCKKYKMNGAKSVFRFQFEIKISFLNTKLLTIKCSM